MAVAVVFLFKDVEEEQKIKKTKRLRVDKKIFLERAKSEFYD